MTDTDRVIIRRDAKDKSIVAFLPDASANRGYIVCYVHIGQHSEASLDYYYSTLKVGYKDLDVRAMVSELSSIGYNVRLVTRLTRPFGGWAK